MMDKSTGPIAIGRKRLLSAWICDPWHRPTNAQGRPCRRWSKDGCLWSDLRTIL